jgi:chromosomal replication initiator protein
VTQESFKMFEGLQHDTSGKGRPAGRPSPEKPVMAQPSRGAEAWDRVRRRLRAELGDDVFSSWFQRIELERTQSDVAHLSVPTRFLKSWIETHYAERLRSHCVAELGTEGGIVLHVRTVSRDASRTQLLTIPEVQTRSSTPELPAAPAQPCARQISPDMRDSTGGILDRRLSFASFIAGKSNAMAFAAAQAIAAPSAGTLPYNPLFIHAGVGLGKTHLVQAIAQEAQLNGRKVAYFTADRFMYGFVSALKAQTALAFKEKLRSIDILIVDDVQFIQGRTIQQEFGHTINALIDAGKQIVVAADRLPADLESLDERIRSRLAGGLAVEIGPLDEELRAKILTNRMAALKVTHPAFTISDEVITYVAHAVATNGRDLDGAANRLLAHATLTGLPVTLERAEAAISDLIRTRDPKRVKIEDIQKLVATRYNVSRADILSERRTAAVVKPRQIAMFLAKSLTPRSLPEIGRRFGGRDHTTVLHAVRKIEKAIVEDRSLNDEVDLLRRMLLD